MIGVSHWNRDRMRDAFASEYFIHDTSSFIPAITVSVQYQWQGKREINPVCTGYNSCISGSERSLRFIHNIML